MKLKNTYAFDTVAIGCFQCLFVCSVVRMAASHEKRAQDKTTVRNSEFRFHSDGLSLSQTAKTDNALAAVTTTFTCKALERVAREDCPAGQTFRQCAGYHDFDAANKALERVYLPPTPAGGVNHLFNHRYEFDPIGAITRRTGNLKDFTKNILYDRLDRMTDANLVGAFTVASSCDDLGAQTNRNSNSGLSDPGAYDYVLEPQSSHRIRTP